MSAPTPSKLDHQQVLQGSFDETTGRLRVDALITSTIIPSPGMEVSILAIDDNIAIRNSNNSNELLIHADGSIDVNATVSIPANQSVNLAQVGGTSTAVNNGVVGNGVQRVVIASDQTAFSTNIQASGTPLTTTGSSLNVNITNGSSGGTALTDKDIFVYGTNSFTPIGGAFQDSSPTLTAGQSGTVRLTTNRALHANIRDASGNELGTSGSPLRIDPTGNTTQPISGTVTANIGTTGGLNLESTQSAFKTANHTDLSQINTTLGSPFQAGGSISNTSFGISGTLPAFTSTPTFNIGTAPTITVTGPLTDTQLRASAVPISGTISGSGNFTVVQPTGTNLHAVIDSGTVTANIGTTNGLALDASLTTLNTSVNTLLKPANTLAAVTTVGTITNPVTVAQSTAANLNATVVQSGTWNISNVSGTISLPTGASTSALQTTGNTSLSSIDGKLVNDINNLNQNINANGQSVPISVQSMAIVGIQITGTWVGTLIFESSINGTDYIEWIAQNFSTVLAEQETTVNGDWTAAVAGRLFFRVRATAWTSGTAIISLSATKSSLENLLVGLEPDGSYPVTLKNTLTGNVNQGIATGTISNSWLTKLTDGSGAIDTSLNNIGITASRALHVTAKQITGVSTSNSSGTNLASGATFSGTIETCRSTQSVQISSFSNQPLTITIQFGDNSGNNFDVKETYTVAASTADFRTFQVSGPTYQVLITNNGGSTTTTLRVNTYLTPFSEPLPKALTQLGNLKTSIQESLPAGTSILGKVGIDQTTPGTTNGVVLNSISDTVSSGSLTGLASVISIAGNGVSEGRISISGTFVGTIQIQGVDDANNTTNLATLQTTWVTTGITTTGQFKWRASDGFKNVQAVFSAYTSGTATVVLRGASLVSAPIVAQPNASNLNAGVRETPDASSAFSPTNSDSTAYEASHLIKASAGTLYSITGYNSNASDQFIQIHNTTTLPADTAVPKVIFLAKATSNFSYSSDKFGRFFPTGMVVCNSSTGPTKTIGAADCWFNCQFI